MAQDIFSDFPYYILEDYFDKLIEVSGADSSSSITQVYTTILFSNEGSLSWDEENNGFLDFKGYYDTQESYVSKSRLIGPRKTIVAKGGQWTTFYAKVNDYGFMPVKLKPTLENVENLESWKDENWLKYTKAEFFDYSTGIYRYDDPTISVEDHLKEDPNVVIEQLTDETYTVVKRISQTPELETFSLLSTEASSSTQTMPISGKSYWFKVWKPYYLSEITELSSGTEMYLRKDSFLHDWFRKDLKYLGDDLANPNLLLEEPKDSRYNPWNHKNFLNDNKLFLYVGKIWPILFDKNYWQIYHRGIKDFMIEAIPDNNINENLKTMSWEVFDRSYQEVYASQKNLYSMLDPLEISDEFLGFLAKAFNVDLDKYNLEVGRQREFIKGLARLLKKKGTYNSLFSYWKSLVLENQNKLTIYERWHPKYNKKTIISPDFSKIKAV